MYIRKYPYNKLKNGKSLGRQPMVTGWRDPANQAATPDEYLANGYNAGYVVQPDDIVIDIDPRNFDCDRTEGLERVAVAFGYFDHADMIESTRTVKSGGGGYHHYYKLPDGVNYKNIKCVVEGLVGVDIKRHGLLIMAPGSTHPNGTPYELINDTAAATLSKHQVSLIWREVSNSSNVEHGQLTPDELDGLVLWHINATDFGSNDEWFPLMCACHHATDGLGVDEFIEWSTSDPIYADCEHQIRCRWESLTVDGGGDKNTIGTLIKLMEGVGADTGPLKSKLRLGSAERDLADILEKSGDDIFVDAAARAGETLAESCQDEGKALGDELTGEGAALKQCQNLNPEATEEDINICLRMVRVAGKYEQMKCITLLAKKTGLTKADIKKLIEEIAEESLTDLVKHLQETTLKEVFNEGRNLIVEPSGIIYAYNGKFWQPISELFLKKLVQTTFASVRAKNPDLEANELSVVNGASELCMIRSAASTPKIQSSERPRSIINCNNGELHVTKTGVIKPIRHKYDSMQTSVLSIDYDPEAECPIFMDTIKGIFEKYPDTGAMVDHMAEIFGYAIQPYKNIPSWFLLKGPGSDGKSTLIKVLAKLMGDSMLSTDTGILKIGTSQADNHATSQMVGKLGLVIEELPRHFKLPDGAIKMLSENRRHTANPKGKAAFSFTYSASLIMCSNSWPKTSDLSNGMRRRAHIIPFNRQFDAYGSEVDIDRVEKITGSQGEMAGVLNWALAGLRRLRERGCFAPPESCDMARQLWMEHSNHMLQFIRDCIELTPRGEVAGKLGTRSNVYDAYREWAFENEIDRKYVKAKGNFGEDMESLGFAIKRGSNNQDWVYGGTLKARDPVKREGSYDEIINPLH